MKILDLKKTAVILVTMLLFLSMQISAFASDNCTVVKIPVRQIFDSEVEGIADYDNRSKRRTNASRKPQYAVFLDNGKECSNRDYTECENSRAVSL